MIRPSTKRNFLELQIERFSCKTLLVGIACVAMLCPLIASPKAGTQTKTNNSETVSTSLNDPANYDAPDQNKLEPQVTASNQLLVEQSDYENYQISVARALRRWSQSEYNSKELIKQYKEWLSTDSLVSKAIERKTTLLNSHSDYKALNDGRKRSSKRKQRLSKELSVSIENLFDQARSFTTAERTASSQDANFESFIRELTRNSEILPELAPLVLSLASSSFSSSFLSLDRGGELTGSVAGKNLEAIRADKNLTAFVQAPEFSSLLVSFKELGLDLLFQKGDALHEQLADRFARAELALSIASFDSLRGECTSTTETMRDIIDGAILSKEKNAFAILQLATCLQQTGKQREALTLYKKIETDKYYSEIANYNASIAYLHQGWWSDMNASIEKLEKSATFPQDSFYDFLTLQKGFNFLYNNMYRDARNTFRKVRLASYESSMALLGLSVAALHQRDYIGALNAAEKLNRSALNSSYRNLEELESFLLIPFIQARLKQQTLALELYQQAITYYQEEKIRLAKALTLFSELHSIEIFFATAESVNASKRASTKETTQNLNSLLNEESSIHILKGSISARHLYDLSAQFRLVKVLEYQALQSQQSSSAKLGPCRSVSVCFTQYLRSAVERSVSDRVAILDNYIAQARFGIAQVYDQREQEAIIKKRRKEQKATVQ